MKARTKKLAWLLSATMALTTVNPGMIAMATEETNGQIMEEYAEPAEEMVMAEEELEEVSEEADVAEEEVVEADAGAEFETEEEQLLTAPEEREAVEVGVYANAQKNISKISYIDVEGEFWKELDNCINYVYFEVQYEDGTDEEVDLAEDEVKAGYDLKYGGHIEFVLKDSDGKETKIGEVDQVGNYSLVMKDSAENEYLLDNIFVQSIKDKVKATWEETGPVYIESEKDTTVWYQFTAPKDGKYWVKDGKPVIYKIEDDVWKKVKSMNAEQGDVYYLGFSYGIYDENDEWLTSWTTQLELVETIKAVTDIRLEKDAFVADADFEYLFNAQMTVTYEDETSKVLKFENLNDEDEDVYVEDERGNRFYAHLQDDEDEDVAWNESQEAGIYTIYFTVDGKKIEGEYTITVKDIAQMNLTDLSSGGTISTEDADYYLPNWYRFTASETGRYRIGGGQSYKIYKKNEEGRLVKVDRIGDRLLRTQAGQTYYLGFWGCVNGDDDEPIYDGQINITSVPAITEIRVNSTQSEFFEENTIDLNQDVTIVYEDGSRGTVCLDEYGSDDTGRHTYVFDTNGNAIILSLQKKGETNRRRFYSILDEGNYTVYLQWAENQDVEAHFDITVKKTATPAGDASIPVTTIEPGQKYPVELTGTKLDAWFRYKAQIDIDIVFKSENSTEKVYDTYGEIYDENGILLDDSDDGDEDYNFELKYKLKAGKTYYLRARMLTVGSYGNFLVSLNVKEHTHNYTEERKNATCTQPGYTQQKCSICGEVKSGSYIALPITAHSFGTWEVIAQPTALTTGLQTRTCSVCGYKESAEIAKLAANITLSASSLPLQVKQSVSLTKLITNMTVGDSLLSCTTSNKKIATVNNTGKVTGKKAGTAKITMNFASGISKTVTVKVQKKKVATSKISNVPGSIKLKVKTTSTLSPVITPITTKDKVTYKTANKKIATVSKKGVVTAKKAGKTTITIKVGKKTKKVKVTVTK